MSQRPRRRTLLRAAWVLAAGWSGCLSREGVPVQGSPPTDSPTASSTTTEKSTTTTVPPGRVTAFDSLSDAGQDLFLHLLGGEPLERPSTQIPQSLWSADYLRYEGSLYELSKRGTGEMVAEYTLSLAVRSKESVGDAELVAFEGLSDEAKHAVRQALENGSFTIAGETLPEALSGGQFLEYEGRHYLMQISVGDIQVWRLSVNKRSA